MTNKIVAGWTLMMLLTCSALMPPAPASPGGTLSGPTLTETPSAAVYYVAPNGNDANPGTLAQPWQTIQKAAETLVAGETVYLRGGTYREQVIPRRSGSAGNFITYAAYPGETVTLDGQGIQLPEWGGLFYVSEKSYIKISGLRVINAGPHADSAGILVDHSSYIVIENNYTYNTVSSGIGVWNSHDVVVAGNEVVLANNDGSQENITIGSTYAFEVHDNHVHHGGPGTNGGEGIDVKHSFNGKVYRNHVHHLQRVGIYVDAWNRHTYDIEVYQNIVHDVNADGLALASEMGGLLENILLYNNLVYRSDYGINVTSYGDASRHPMRHIGIVNNTVVANGLGTWGGGIVVDNADVEDLALVNNLVSGNLSFQIVVYPHVPAGQVRVAYNLIDGFRDLEEGETRGTHYVEGDPRFVNPAVANYRLQADSPALNAGDNASLPAGVGTDLDGRPRIVGGTVDLGAYEYQPGQNVFLPVVLRVRS